ncbi:MAG: cell filamentation protein Fic [Flavobacterium sp. BFFFF1]|uniref:Fic family protein n=1 Tax=Flavobacterium sp. BFFFF1 TaxID=2015557 RepID=UPI000BC9625C|nr:Fic family protein [Flavobacterium sp. BFFFF1]OYU79944.1 MAG: cell filamentation protein Fic [Flavobacterium sp. BFFFF1]
MHPLDIVDELMAELKSLPAASPENKQKLDKKFRLEFNYNSNHLEGNTLSYSETELLLIFDDTKGSHTMREYEEMKAHDVAYHMTEQLAKDRERPLTEQDIRDLNKVLLVRPFWKEAITPDGQDTRRLIKVGEYKEQPNSVRLANGEIFNYASPAETPALMQELIEWFRGEEEAVHAVTLAALLHYKFVRIHPFDDGNGRVSRLLMNYVLLKYGYPPVIIKSKDKVNYLRVLRLADVGDYAPFIAYIAEQLQWSLNMALKAARNEDLAEDDDLDKEISLFKKELTGRRGDNELIEKSGKVIVDLYDSSLASLFALFKEKLSQFDDMFAKKHYSIRFSSRNDRQFQFKDVDELFLTMKSHLTLTTEEIANQEIYTITDIDFVEMQIYFEAFKYDGINTFGISSTLYVTFDRYSYVINNKGSYSGDDYFIKSLYSEKLSIEEAQQIVRTLAAAVLTEIKNSKKSKI